jgi:hypothetical protein
MQRRAAAVYVAFLLVIAVGAYTFAAAAESPEITVENPEYGLSEGDEFDVNGTTYTVAKLGEESSGGGHGGGGEAELTATIEWNVSAEESEDWAPGPGNAIEYQGGNYEVIIPNETDPTQFTLREMPGDDLTVYENSDGNRVVEVQRDGETEYVPLDEYEALERITVAENQSIQYNDQNATVTEVTNESVTVQWQVQETEDVSLTEGATTEQISDEELVAHFPDHSTLELSSDLESYNDQAEDKEFFEQRTNGLTMAAILAGITAFLLLAMAYLPRRE